jgi:hypothetical protein
VTAGSTSALRIVAFGEQEPGAWGAVWSLGGASIVALGDGSNVTVGSAALEGKDRASDWTLRADGIDLTISGDPEMYVAPDDGTERFDQLCRVTGRFRSGEAERDISCLAFRGARVLDRDLERTDSIRGIGAVFENGDGIGLVAVRPARAKGHGSDAVSAAVLEAGGPMDVEDPRLSTTYAHDGRPSRASLELWIGEIEDEQRVRRATGEALGPRASGSRSALQFSADLFRWHSRGAEGIGVYLLARLG